MHRKNSFIAIDFETATGYRNSVCEVGVCVVIHGEIVDTRSWLVRPPENIYWRNNTMIHGIRPEDTEDAPDFDQVWEEIERLYLDDFLEENLCGSASAPSRHPSAAPTAQRSVTFVAHNASFDRSCLHRTAELYRLHLPNLHWECSLATARRIYDFRSNSLGYLCAQLGIPEGTHHRAGDDAEMCARLYLRELADLP